ncbi:MAG: 6-carboxytetrahydropterin synthase QueD [Dehalococcoidales bacterium]|jgi:6-pyruvoyltetrahydropterin/6-carboxytetrahydropterin synthase|nr:6-carboxytetrahydropterin synthase QueD [Dehalococcoidales bacterium]MDD3265031.1 6-carboxytetrahydropterin synthase QueD [Dehalococcoidales bacterium]MDD4322287.1 6-carboxytetrahydropterin synthase QueD [Dehalococcoidales bacterium]MDD4794353.1 6-carboxytetrahydropterin synthase QueD [Dehalococcoidales bacterium]MDD5122580.1 6-carboxytetrahydropterin synthase QueD [Dehalococcoidales bacterium]
MYLVNVERHFDAAHYLRGYQGKCENLHGHRYRVVARLKAFSNQNAGMAYDFTILKKQLAGILERFDHRCLNEVPPFDEINPSAENIARTIYFELKDQLGKLPEGMHVDAITVWESPESWVEYQPD